MTERSGADPVTIAGNVTTLLPGFEPGDVLVPTLLDRAGPAGSGQGTRPLPDGVEPVPCDGAQLLAGELRRAGIRRVHLAPLGELALAALDPMARQSLAAALESGRRPATALFAVAGPEGPPPDAAARIDTVLDGWDAALGARVVLLAEPRSFCAGVERAIDTVEVALKQHPHPVYVRKQIVHNLHVVRDLESRGAVFVDELDEVPSGATVVFSAHGVAPAVRTQAQERGLQVIDATCPLVTKVHAEVRRFDRRGAHIILIGHAGHEEAVGTLGEAPGRTILVQTPQDVERLPDLEGEISYVMQTTLATDEAAEVIEALRARFPAIKGPGTDDICYATTNRQNAVRAVAEQADLIYVVGSANSSNSLRLAELGQRKGVQTLLVEDVGEIRLADLAGARCVGLTAGASAPPLLVDQIVASLRSLGPVTVSERRVTVETLHFGLPRELQKR